MRGIVKAVEETDNRGLGKDRFSEDWFPEILSLVVVFHLRGLRL